MGARPSGGDREDSKAADDKEYKGMEGGKEGGGLTVRDEATFGMSRVIFSTMARGERSQSQDYIRDTTRQEKKCMVGAAFPTIKIIFDVASWATFCCIKITKPANQQNDHAHQKAGTKDEWQKSVVEPLPI